MPNLSVENLGRITQSGSTEEFFGAGGAGRPMAESKVLEEMRKEGLPEAPALGQQGVHQPQGFVDMLKQSFDEVNETQHEADRAIRELVAGRSKNIHETMLTLERADTSLKLMTQVRNKILDAYREIMRMQV